MNGDITCPAARISWGRGKGRTFTPLTVALATKSVCSDARSKAT
jgi:hypothetical protein